MRPIKSIILATPEEYKKKNAKNHKIEKLSRFYNFFGAKGYCVSGNNVHADCTAANSTQVAEQKPKRFTVWRGKNIIVKRYTSKEFFTINKGQKRCTKGFKKCESGFCVRQYSKCPITSIEITRKKEIVDDFKNNTNVEIKKLSNKRWMIVRRDKTKDFYGAINGFWAHLNEFPCYNIYLGGELHSDKKMDVDRHIQSNCEKDGFGTNSETFKFVDKMKLLRLWEDNLQR